MIVITGNPRCGTSLMLKCFEDGGYYTGFEGKQGSENKIFRELCYKIKKAAGMEPLIPELDEYLVGCLMPAPTKIVRLEGEIKDLLERFKELELEVVKYPFMSAAIPTLIQDELFRDAFYVFMYRDLKENIESIHRFIKKGRFAPRILKKNAHKYPEWATERIIKDNIKKFDMLDVRKLKFYMRDFIHNSHMLKKIIRKRTGYNIVLDRIGGKKVA